MTVPGLGVATGPTVVPVLAAVSGLLGLLGASGTAALHRLTPNLS